MKSVIIAAAKMIMSDINSIQAETNKKFYPTFQEKKTRSSFLRVYIVTMWMIRFFVI